jgi:AICAR transformylase/IMP cyclohydrolase PurH
VATFIEAVFAPAVDGDALAVLAKKPNMRVVIPSRGGDGRRGAQAYDPASDLELRSIVAASWSRRATTRAKVRRLAVCVICAS